MHHCCPRLSHDWLVHAWTTQPYPALQFAKHDPFFAFLFNEIVWVLALLLITASYGIDTEPETFLSILGLGMLWYSCPKLMTFECHASGCFHFHALILHRSWTIPAYPSTSPPAFWGGWWTSLGFTTRFSHLHPYDLVGPTFQPAKMYRHIHDCTSTCIDMMMVFLLFWLLVGRRLLLPFFFFLGGGW